MAERQSVRRHTGRHMNQATLLRSKQRSNSVKFHLILFYLGRCTIKLLLTEISVHRGNICSDIQGHGPHCVWSIHLECQNKYFLVLSSVNKSILLVKIPKLKLLLIQRQNCKFITFPKFLIHKT